MKSEKTIKKGKFEQNFKAASKEVLGIPAHEKGNLFPSSSSNSSSLKCITNKDTTTSSFIIQKF